MGKMKRVYIIKYPPGYPENEYGLLIYDNDIETVYPCIDLQHCEELRKDFENPARVNAKLLMYNYHLFASDPVTAKKKIEEWLKQKAKENELYKRIYEAFLELYG